jgi:formate C-acetyltransferase
VYFAFKNFADRTSATPDGRRYGDILSQGIAPNRTGCTATATEVVNFLKEIDFKDIPGNAVLDLMLPLSTSWTTETVSAFIRSALLCGVPTLQLNLVDKNTLIDARIHPHDHKDLTVRISGLSAIFIKLSDSVQEEIISRRFF